MPGKSRFSATLLFAPTVIATLALTTVARAADVLWDSPQPITGPGDIIADGDLIAAVNEGNSTLVVDPGGLNLTFAAGNDFPNSPFNSGNLGSGDAAFDSVLNQADWGGTGANPHSFAIGGLDVGDTYDIQMFVSDIRSCCNGRSMQITGGANTANVYMGDNAGSPSAPQYVVGTFTADATSQSFSFLGTHPSAGNLRHPQLNAYVLRKQTGPPEPTGTHPFISEFVAVGNDTRQDEDGNTPDWLEIYNPTGTDIDLAGYHLSDDDADLTKWTFPATVLQAGRYLVVYASDKNRATAGSELHTNFKLASGGEYLALTAPDGTTVLSEFAPTFPAQEAGFSYGVGGPAPDDPTGYFASPTPGSANGTLLSAPLLAPAILAGLRHLHQLCRSDPEHRLPRRPDPLHHQRHSADSELGPLRPGPELQRHHPAASTGVRPRHRRWRGDRQRPLPRAGHQFQPLRYQRSRRLHLRSADHGGRKFRRRRCPRTGRLATERAGAGLRGRSGHRPRLAGERPRRLPAHRHPQAWSEFLGLQQTPVPRRAARRERRRPRLPAARPALGIGLGIQRPMDRQGPDPQPARLRPRPRDRYRGPAYQTLRDVPQHQRRRAHRLRVRRRLRPD